MTQRFILTVALLLASTPTMSASRPEPDPSDKSAVADCVATMLHAIDVLDWTIVRESFTTQVDVDYTSLFGGSPSTTQAEDLIKTWRELLPGFDATQHLIGPVVVTRDRATDNRVTAETHVRGYHRITAADGGETWMVAGHYTMGLAHEAGQWRICSIKLSAFYQEGNLDLPKIAAQRATDPSQARKEHFGKTRPPRPPE
ncbi:MAG TPA: nuclear transport factor 2 family protein [Opitutaceae bacterium]